MGSPRFALSFVVVQLGCTLLGGLRGERRSLFLPKFGEGAAAVVRYHIFSRADLQSVECRHRISCQKWKYSEKLALELVESVY